MEPLITLLLMTFCITLICSLIYKVIRRTSDLLYGYGESAYLSRLDDYSTDDWIDVTARPVEPDAVLMLTDEGDHDSQ